MSLVTRKPVFGGLPPRKTQTGLLSTEASQSLEILNLASITSATQGTTKGLIRLRECAG